MWAERVRLFRDVLVCRASADASQDRACDGVTQSHFDLMVPRAEDAAGKVRTSISCMMIPFVSNEGEITLVRWIRAAGKLPGRGRRRNAGSSSASIGTRGNCANFAAREAHAVVRFCLGRPNGYARKGSTVGRLQMRKCYKPLARGNPAGISAVDIFSRE